MQRYFIDKNQIHNLDVSILGQDMHHIKNVMRLKVGDSLIINTYEGRSFDCVIESFHKDQVLSKIINELFVEHNILNLTLGLALIKKDNFELSLKKVTELGVSGIIPINTERSIVKINDFTKKKERYFTICKESSEQSERMEIPYIGELTNLNDLETNEYDHLYFAYAREEENQIGNIFKTLSKDAKTFVLIGPEGGFSQKEISLLVSKGYKSISLGKTILRAETAAIYVASVFRLMVGEIQ